MLNIYLMRESIDKNKFIFEQTQNTDGSKVLIVPDQYTLESEKNALAYLKKSAIFDLEILSPTRLGYKILKETGKPKELLLNKYGRQMLLYSILQKNIGNLKHYNKPASKSGFVELLDEQLGEFQQYYINSTAIRSLLGKIDEKSVLHQKLSDLAVIYEDYENQITQKYIDTKDINEIFIERVHSSDFVANTTFWVSEYDYMAPKNLAFLMQLVSTGKAVNIILTGDMDSNSKDKELFDITKKFVNTLKQACKTIGSEFSITQISEKKYAIDKKSEAIKTIEREIFAYPMSAANETNDDIHLNYAKNIYTEAETVAVYIRNLLREKKYRFHDIAVICNDIDSYGSIIKRTFEEYGIRCFLDKNRDILHNSLVALNLTLLQAARDNLTTNAVISYLKSGFSELNSDEVEILEKYSKKYKIRGNMWLKPFYKFDSTAKFEPELEEINALRDRAVSPLAKFREEINSKSTADEKIKTLYNFIKNDLRVPEKLKTKIREYENMGLTENALENAQIWDITINLYEQSALILKDETLSNELIEEILKSGFSAMKMGMIPSSSDEVLIGNIQRSRIGKIPILIIIAAIDGIFPLTSRTDSLIGDDEKSQLLENFDLEAGKLTETRHLEENMAIYRTLCAPLNELFVIYEQSTPAGDSMKPSRIFQQLCELFPKNPVVGDIYFDGKILNLLSTSEKTLLHIAKKLRNEEKLTDAEALALLWCRKNDEKAYKKLSSALKFKVKAAKLSKNDAKTLYLDTAQTMRLSPSKLEKYAACPFAYFLEFGIKPSKDSPFELSGKQFGDIYHNMVRQISKTLSCDNLPLSHDNSKWQTITDEELTKLIDDILSLETQNYQNGFLFDDEDGAYKIVRIRSVCYQAIRAIIAQVRAGKIKQMLCEIAFSNAKNATLPAITLDCDIPVRIEGKIDRIDILHGENGEYCKVIDYKSGTQKFDKEAVSTGFQLQLAIYLNAATGGMQNFKPAGMFYFNFADKDISLDASNSNDSLTDELFKKYKLDGIFTDSEDVINSLDSDFSGFSKIIPARKTKDGITKNEKYMLSENEFNDFLNAASGIISKLCKKLSSGNIEIYPSKTKNSNACEFCDFASICKFDKSLPTSGYRKSW